MRCSVEDLTGRDVCFINVGYIGENRIGRSATFRQVQRLLWECHRRCGPERRWCTRKRHRHVHFYSRKDTFLNSILPFHGKFKKRKKSKTWLTDALVDGRSPVVLVVLHTRTRMFLLVSTVVLVEAKAAQVVVWCRIEELVHFAQLDADAFLTAVQISEEGEILPWGFIWTTKQRWNRHAWHWLRRCTSTWQVEPPLHLYSIWRLMWSTRNVMSPIGLESNLTEHCVWKILDTRHNSSLRNASHWLYRHRRHTGTLGDDWLMTSMIPRYLEGRNAQTTSMLISGVQRTIETEPNWSGINLIATSIQFSQGDKYFQLHH